MPVSNNSANVKLCLVFVARASLSPEPYTNSPRAACLQNLIPAVPGVGNNTDLPFSCFNTHARVMYPPGAMSVYVTVEGTTQRQKWTCLVVHKTVRYVVGWRLCHKKKIDFFKVTEMATQFCKCPWGSLLKQGMWTKKKETNPLYLRLQSCQLACRESSALCMGISIRVGFSAVALRSGKSPKRLQGTRLVSHLQTRVPAEVSWTSLFTVACLYLDYLWHVWNYFCLISSFLTLPFLPGLKVTSSCLFQPR